MDYKARKSLTIKMVAQLHKDIPTLSYTLEFNTIYKYVMKEIKENKNAPQLELYHKIFEELKEWDETRWDEFASKAGVICE